MKRVYISGKITGEPIEQVIAKFAETEFKLAKNGYDPVNPLKNGLPQESAWEHHMRVDISLMMTCNAIYMLPDWKFSTGARIEKQLADDLKFEFIK